VSPFYSYHRRAMVGSPPATSNLYDVLKRVDWLAIFSPWAIINRSKMYAMTTKQNTCAGRTPANNAVLQNFEKTHEDAEPVVSNRAFELSEGKFFSDERYGGVYSFNGLHELASRGFAFFFGVKKERPVVASDGKVAGRVNKTLSTSMDHTSSPSHLHLLSTIFVLLNFGFISATHAQSQTHNSGGGAAEVVEPFITRTNIQDFVEIKDIAHKKELILQYSPTADLEKYPLYEYKARTEAFDPLITGAIVPEYIWELPLRVVNDPLGRDSITLRQLAGEKILVLD